MPAHFVQVIRPAMLVLCHPSAVGSRAENQPASQLSQQLAVAGIGRLALRLGQAAVSDTVRLRHFARDVVKQNRERSTARVAQLPDPRLQQFHLQVIRVTNRQAGGDAVKELNVMIPAGLDERSKPAQLIVRVELPPQRPVLEVVLRAVQVGIQFKRLHQAEELQALLLTPGTPVKALNDTLEK